jgi:hypothetical protein
MAADFRFRLRLMRRRARLFSRQIAIAMALTMAAAGLLASAVIAPGQQAPAMQQAATGSQ